MCSVQMWSPLLEKAYAVHGGGWDNLKGGRPAIGLACITGCLDSYIIKNKSKNVSGYETYTYQAETFKWDEFTGNTSKHKGGTRNAPELWEGAITADALFDKLCEWDDAGYIICAASSRPGTSGNHDNDNQGISDSHAWTVIASKKNVCGKFNMICLRNPWGNGRSALHGEFKGGAGTAGWYDGGPLSRSLARSLALSL